MDRGRNEGWEQKKNKRKKNNSRGEKKQTARLLILRRVCPAFARNVARTGSRFVVRLAAIQRVINDPRIKENSSMTPDASVSFYTATMSAHCRSISTVRQIYCVMDGQGKLQIVLSLKDRLRLTFPAPACTLDRASRIVLCFEKQPPGTCSHDSCILSRLVAILPRARSNRQICGNHCQGSLVIYCR